MNHEEWMRRAIEEARKGIAQSQTPFGAVVVRDGDLVAAGHNEVWRGCDPTAHAEIVAIRRAADRLNTINLSGCEMYTTCEPCPMCAAAIHWCKLDAVYFGATIADARQAGFTELGLAAAELYERGGSGVRVVPNILNGQCAALFRDWISAGNCKGY
jgi:tRNA(Arg) A34 adenosine deaminase TadA